MFFNLVKKEINYQLKSIVPYLLLAVIFLFYFSQYGADISKKSIVQPVSEMQYMHNYMTNIINTGEMHNISSPEPLILTTAQTDLIKNALISLKSISVKDKYGMLQPTSETKYTNILNQLNADLGYDTNFSEVFRPHFLRHRLNYGRKEVTNNQTKMLIVFKKILSDYHQSSIYTYPIGFAKKVKLTPARKQAFKNVLGYMVDNPSLYLGSNVQMPHELSFICSYEELSEALDNLDKVLGGGSDYSPTYRSGFFYESKTYLEAQKDYESIVKKDKISNAFARLYADYMGITAGIFPVFLAAFVLQRDKRYRMTEIINCKQINPFAYVLAKYLALISLILLFYMLVATHATFEFISMAKSLNLVIDVFAFYKHTLIWILPTVMFVVAIGMLVSVIFKRGIVAIPVQFILCYRSIMPLIGDYSLSKFIIRFNAVVSYNEYQQWGYQILGNRIFFIILSLALVTITSLIWSKKRSFNSGFSKALFRTGKV